MFYGASKISNRKDLCAHCAKKDCFPNKDLKKQFKAVLPICELCKAKGRKEITRGPLQLPLLIRLNMLKNENVLNNVTIDKMLNRHKVFDNLQ